jgi:hypothetical protein
MQQQESQQKKIMIEHRLAKQSLVVDYQMQVLELGVW